MVLIISNKWDVTVDFVILELQKRKHPYARLNAEDLSQSRAAISVPILSLTIERDQKILDFLRDVRVVWNRRPGYPFDDIPRSERPSPGLERFVSEQWRSWRGAFEVVAGVHWINQPDAEHRAENKVRQLIKAQEMGFKVPDTAITNDWRLIRDFLIRHPGAITKALSAPLIEEEDKDQFIFTSEIGDISESDDPAIRVCPVIVQERITPKTDYRVTVVEEEALAARIQSQSENSPLDWRTQKEGLSFKEVSIPAEVSAKCVSLVKALGLYFGAIDLVERGGEFFFLEINPNGEWGWLQKPAGLPIAERLVDLFVTLDDKQ